MKPNHTALLLIIAFQGLCLSANCEQTSDENLQDVRPQQTGVVDEATYSILHNQSTDESQQLKLDNNEPPPRVEGKKASSGRKACVPMLNLPSFFSNSSTPSTTTRSAGQTIGPESNFSFAMGDIDMPVSQSEGTINSAIKLLSTFGNQFDLESIGDLEPVENVVKFRENRLQVQGLNLTMLNVHLHTDSDPKFAIGITIKNTTMTGQFAYNGPLAAPTDSKYAGYYRMSIENIYLVASSNLTKRQKATTTTTGEEKEVGDVVGGGAVGTGEAKQYILRTDDFKMNISNLGYISIDIFDSKEADKPTSNYMLRMLQRVLQRTIKRTYYTFESYIRETLERESKRSLDCELTRFTPLLDNTGISSHQSDLERILRSEIIRSKLNTVPLPDFEHQQNILGTSATIQFSNGSLNGLDRLKLNGETRIKLQNDYMFVNTSIGWSDLKPYYNWSLSIGSGKSHMSKGFVSFNIKEIDFDAVITKGLKPHTQIVVDQLVIRQLDSPKMDISGLPGMNRVTRGMVNFFMGRLKQRLSSSIQPVLKQQLERSLNRLNIFV